MSRGLIQHCIKFYAVERKKKASAFCWPCDPQSMSRASKMGYHNIKMVEDNNAYNHYTYIRIWFWTFSLGERRSISSFEFVSSHEWKTVVSLSSIFSLPTFPYVMHMSQKSSKSGHPIKEAEPRAMHWAFYLMLCPVQSYTIWEIHKSKWLSKLPWNQYYSHAQIWVLVFVTETENMSTVTHDLQSDNIYSPKTGCLITLTFVA